MKKIKIYFMLTAIPFILAACSMSDKDNSGGGGDVSGKGGSLARFTISGNYLYTVDQSSLHTISLADAEHPQKVANNSLGIYTETIYPYQNSLLLGTETGMFVYDLSNPANPQQVTYFQHIRSCDPVVAQDDYAYVTLNTGNQRCFNGTNELQIINIKNLNSPQLVKTISLSTPLGLDIANDTLYVCDQGLKVLNVADKQNPVQINYFSNINAQDVIHQPGRVIVIGTDGLHQYKQTSAGLQKISTIPISK
ncbi:MAG: LVIVD repeat-containing protein [Bacteroidales bacterium]